MFGFGRASRQARQQEQALQELKVRALQGIASLLPHHVQLPADVRQRLAQLAVDRLGETLKRREVSTHELKEVLRGPVEWAAQSETQAQRELAQANLETPAAKPQ